MRGLALIMYPNLHVLSIALGPAENADIFQLELSLSFSVTNASAGPVRSFFLPAASDPSYTTAWYKTHDHVLQPVLHSY